MAERMTISNGIVFVDDGVVENVAFNACAITLGKGVTLKNCTIDERSEVTTNG